MKILIAVMTCHSFRDRAQAVRETWARDVAADSGADLRFFLGKREGPVPGDTVQLNCRDDYRSFPAKIQEMRRWALAEGYDWVWKFDDDTYVRVDRLLALPFREADYFGRLRGPSASWPAPYCSGFAYCLSRKALLATVAGEDNGDFAEDRQTGNLLLAAGISPVHEPRLAVAWSKNNALSFREPPRKGNDIAAACEFNPGHMRRVHADFLAGVKSEWHRPQMTQGSLSRVAVMIKTFLRDGYLNAAVRGIQRQMPDVKMVIVDDGWESFEKIQQYANLRLQRHECVWLPFDSGFGAKANRAIPLLDREYVLIGSDDFDFGDQRVRAGVERMQAVLDERPEIGIVSGRVDKRSYEGYIIREPRRIREIPLDHSRFETTRSGIRFWPCDLTANYSLVRRRVLDTVHWHAEFKIGGDHFTFFDDAKKAGWGIALVEGANINQLRFNPLWQDKTYSAYRRRAKESLPRFFEMQGIDEYISFDGRVDRVTTTAAPMEVTAK